jgi:GAF domain-containing protein
MRDWLRRPQSTNGQALLVGVLSGVVTALALYAARWVLTKAGVIAPHRSVPLWLAAVAIGAATAVGLLLGRKIGLRSRVPEVEAYETYTEHIRDALADMRRRFAGELPDFSLRDFVENGLFQPAYRLMSRGGHRGDVRFSILQPAANGATFVMSKEGDLFPALGHSLDARQNLSMDISGSFSELAFRSGKVYASNDLAADNRFRPHPRARAGREYASIVSVPLWKNGAVDGVLNVIATKTHAFEPVDRTYVTLLGSVIDVARSPD